MSQLAITEATPQTDVLSQIKDIISQKNVELLHLQFIDLEGTLKHVTVPVEKLDDVVEGKSMFDGSSVVGFSPINKSEL